MNMTAERLQEIAEKIATEQNIEVFSTHLRWGRSTTTLEVSLTKPTGVSIDDCSSFSRALSSFLDGFFPEGHPYAMEVSSAGIERTLKTWRHWETAVGESVSVTWEENGQRKTLRAKISRAESRVVYLSEGENAVAVPFEAIRKARTYFDFGKKQAGEKSAGTAGKSKTNRPDKEPE